MNVKLKAACAAMLTALAGACAQSPVAGERAAPPLVAQAQTPAAPPGARSQRRAPGSASTQPQNLPAIELTPGLLYELLAAEIAGQRGAAAISLSKYLELAQRTRDPRIAQRAVEIAFYERNNEKALEAARLWVAAAPANMEARQTLAGLLISAGQSEEAYPHLEQLLAAESTNVAEGFVQLDEILFNPIRKMHSDLFGPEWFES